MPTLSRTFDFMDAADQEKECRRTYNAVRQHFEHPRPHFPNVAVFWNGRELERHVVDSAFDRAVIARHMAGRPPGFDLLVAFRDALPEAIAADEARRARFEPRPLYSSGRDRNVSDATGSLPSEIVAPLVLHGGAAHG